MRSTTFALLGITAAAGLGLVAIFSQQGWPLLSPAPLPAPPARSEAVDDAMIVTRPAGLAAGAGAREPGPRREATITAPSRRHDESSGVAPQLRVSQPEPAGSGAPPAVPPEPGAASPVQAPAPAPGGEPAPAPQPAPQPAPAPVTAPPTKPSKASVGSPDQEPPEPQQPDGSSQGEGRSGSHGYGYGHSGSRGYGRTGSRGYGGRHAPSPEPAEVDAPAPEPAPTETEEPDPSSGYHGHGYGRGHYSWRHDD